MFDPDSDSAFTQQGKEGRNYVKFYRQWVRNNFKSKEQGIEVGEEQDFIIIICPGQPKTEVRRKASEQDKMQYSQEWSAYQQGKENQISGTPIELLPGLANGMADALKAIYVYTIEQMAGLPDLSLQKVGMGGSEIREKARAYLSKTSGEVTALRQQLADMQAQMAAMQAKMMEAPAPKPRGRKPKAEAVMLS